MGDAILNYFKNASDVKMFKFYKAFLYEQVTVFPLTLCIRRVSKKFVHQCCNVFNEKRYRNDFQWCISTLD